MSRPSVMEENLAGIFDVALEQIEQEVDIKRQELAVDITAAKEISTQISKEKREKNTEKDYDATRQNLIDLLQDGKDALNNLLILAKDSENARVYEVFGNLMKQIADINHQLLDLDLKKKELDQEETKPAQGATTNNIEKAVFVGSTKDLNDLINQRNNNATN